MRVLFFLVILLSAYYIAAAFRFAPLLTLCVAESGTLVLLALSAWYLSRRLGVGLSERYGEAVQFRERACTLRVRNGSRLPAARLELLVSSRWLWEEGAETFRLTGGAAYGDSRLTFQVRAAHCGLLLLRLEQARVYDFLSLFHWRVRPEGEQGDSGGFPGGHKSGGDFGIGRRAGKPAGGGFVPLPGSAGTELRLAVYPARVPLKVRLSGSDMEGVSHSTNLPGGGSGEVLKIRAYQAGDSLRRVHWNQSARTDQLWMKEFPREADRRVHVLLDRGPWDSPWAADGFWQTLYALSLGLLDSVSTVRFHWLEGGVPRCFDGANEEQVRELLLILYASALPGTVGKAVPGRRDGRENTRGKQKASDEKNPRGKQKASDKGTPPERPATGAETWTVLLDQIPSDDRFLRLTGDLRLYAGSREAVRFEPKGLLRQIREASLEL